MTVKRVNFFVRIRLRYEHAVTLHQKALKEQVSIDEVVSECLNDYFDAEKYMERIRE